ncbi:MAG: hypothetical protein UCH28_11110 [Adlercreutzia sp.]|nr:hypothetical protein [Adlercreutzia sp.]
MAASIKNRLAYFVTAALVVLLACGFLATQPTDAYATTAAKGAKVHTLKENVTYTQYDATGDRKADTVKVATSYDNYDFGNKITVYLNGKRAFSKSTIFYYVEAQLIQLKNGKCFIYLFAPIDNGDAEVCALYQVKNGKLKRVINFNKGLGSKIGYHVGGQVKKVSGNSMTVSFTSMSYMTGFISANYTYKYKSGTLKKTSTTGKLSVGFTPKSTYKTKKAITAYKNTKCTSKKFTIKKGAKVKFLKTYVKGNTVRFQVKSGGKTGWIKVATRYDSPLMYKYQYRPGSYTHEPPFEGIILAG